MAINGRSCKVRLRLFYMRAAAGNIYELAQIIFIIILVLYLFTTSTIVSKFRITVQRIQFMGENHVNEDDESDFASTKPPRPPDIPPADGEWQHVNGTEPLMYVFSAYVELRIAAFVRVVAVASSVEPNRVRCRMWLPGGFTYTVRARIQPIRQNALYSEYGAAFVLCLPRNPDIQFIATHLDGGLVSIIAESDLELPPTNLLVIKSTRPTYKINELNLHVCVPPLYSFGGGLEWLIEWFEFNRLLNVSHIYMYDHVNDARVHKLIDHYVRQGILTIRSWKLPLRTKKAQFTAQLAAYNDCLYRSMAYARWLLILDYDELVVPREKITLVELLRNMTAKHKRRTSFVVQNVFFFIDWMDEPTYEDETYQFTTAIKTQRTDVPEEFYNYSRYFVYPRSVVELGTNFVTEILPAAKSFNSVGVPPRLALLHHYFDGCPYKDCLNATSRRDLTAHLWTNQLRNNVEREVKKMNKSSNIGPLFEEKDEDDN